MAILAHIIRSILSEMYLPHHQSNLASDFCEAGKEHDPVFLSVAGIQMVIDLVILRGSEPEIDALH
ncbi:hypothetical protein WL82_28970 [Burkholderia ubonensis]|nr:hypothetical protein WL82_28970 [Burkholderia ubonensis]